MPENPTGRDRSLRSRRLRLVVALLVSVLGAGTAGYALVEGWSAWDAFYNTVLAVTTLSVRDHLSLEGQVVTVLLAIGGVGTVLYAFTLIAAEVIEGGLQERLGERRRVRMIDDLKDHFILCGNGRIGSVIAAEFRREGVPFVVVERDPDRLRTALDRGDLAVEADASREDVLKRVGIDRARGLVAVVGTDAENVYAVLTARVMRPDLFIIARAESDDAGQKMLRAGANRVLAPYDIGALQMAQTALRPAVVDFVQLATGAGNLDLAMEQIKLAPGSELAGRSLVEANLRQRYGVVVVGIQRDERRRPAGRPRAA
jgi:voltage-gated potassium channel